MLSASFAGQTDGGILGYYRMPAIHGNTIVFTAEGDLWKVSDEGGVARRLTSHPSVESHAAISPDGRWVAFTASYEGPSEAYVMPIDGGIPARVTYEGGNATVVGWTSKGEVLYSTGKYSTLPNTQLCKVDPKSRKHELIPLAQASDGTFAEDGKQMYFTRFQFQGSQTKRYQGGTAQSIWKWNGDASEAKPLTTDFKGTSKTPMFWNGRVYFASDRDGVMNLWSMSNGGKDLKKLTRFTDYDVQYPDLEGGRIVYQQGADLHLFDIQKGTDHLLPIRLASDLDQMRETWVKNPLSWTTSAHISPNGSKVALTARGQVFVAPVKPSRMVEVTRNKRVRYREAQFSSDNKSLIALSDESGEVEVWKLDPTGVRSHAPEQLTKDATILRLEANPSPDGKFIAHTDKAHRLFLYDVTSKTNKLIADSNVDNINSLSWSSDSKYLAFLESAPNLFDQLKLYVLSTAKTFDITTNRYNSSSPSFSLDGKFLYFLSDRHLETQVGSPWGPRAPEPYFDQQQVVCYVPLQPGNRSPFQPDDELSLEKKEPETPKGTVPAINTDGLASRIQFAPIAPGNYRGLAVCGHHLFFLASPPGDQGPSALVSVEIKNKKIKTDTILPGAGSFETTPDQKKILARTPTGIFVIDANGAPADPAETKVNLDGWTFSFEPREEWQQMFDDAWRLHRDFLYAPNMHGLDWPAVKRKYRPLVERVTDRYELSDILAQMVGEVSLLHTFVAGGEHRPGTDSIDVATLGGVWVRDSKLGGYKLTRIYHTDPDMPNEVSPLLKPGVDMKEGDVIAEIDGTPTLSVPDANELLRSKSGHQVRLKVYVGGIPSKPRDVILVPISAGQEFGLKYADWEFSRRQEVEKASAGTMGYVHLRAMGGEDYNQWEREFYPAFDREGLIVDVRHNNGGNIDSWILEKLMRKMWMLWNQHKGAPTWNMQFAFRGKVVVLCDESTASDGEAFSEGFRRLGLGKIIGTRTWGGEVWLSGSNRLVDRGVATAAENGVFGPEGKWLIEGHGVDPDIIVDNLPRATFEGHDLQLEAAIKYLADEIKKNPAPVPAVPPYPDKSFPPRKKG